MKKKEVFIISALIVILIFVIMSIVKDYRCGSDIRHTNDTSAGTADVRDLGGIYGKK